jgi:hypothetical protein
MISHVEKVDAVSLNLRIPDSAVLYAQIYLWMIEEMEVATEIPAYSKMV